ncbi:hypothetical protein [Flavobacterium lindanitolerans]
MKINNYIIKNIGKILSESYKWRNRELLEKSGSTIPILTFGKAVNYNKYYLIISLIISVFIEKLFAEKITTFLMTSLSIFIGLFISILILIFDKFLNRNEKYKKEIIETRNPDLKPNFIRTRNFTRRFTFVLLESLIIAFSTIVLLLISLVYNDIFLENLLDYKFVGVDIIKPENISTFFINFFIIITKTLIVTLLIRFCIFLFFLIGSLGEYMKGVLYGKVDI